MPKAKGRSEAQFTTEMWRSIKHALIWQVFFYHKYPDLWTSIGFDAWLQLVWWRYIAMEYKINKNEKNLELNKFFYNREHELAALSKQVNLGNEAYIVVNCYYPRTHNYCLVFTIEQYYGLLKKIYPKKSIKLDDPILLKHCKFVDRHDAWRWWKNDGVWNISLFIKDI